MEIERLGRKLGTFTIDWIYFGVLFAFLGFMLGLALASNLENFAIWPYTLVVIALYYIFMLVLRQIRPRIYLYENGVFVIEKGETSLFTWDELSHFTGQRHTNYLNGIPLWRTGANQFFAGEEAAFRIGAMTNWADVLADYCLSRMAERHIEALVQVVRTEDRLQLDLIDISTEGIGSTKEFYQWAQIKDLTLEHNPFVGGTNVNAKIEGQFFPEMIGTLGTAQAYALLGVVDSLIGSKYLPRMQALAASPYKRFMEDKSFLLALLIVALLIGGVVIAVALGKF